MKRTIDMTTAIASLALCCSMLASAQQVTATFTGVAVNGLHHLQTVTGTMSTNLGTVTTTPGVFPYGGVETSGAGLGSSFSLQFADGTTFSLVDPIGGSMSTYLHVARNPDTNGDNTFLFSLHPSTPSNLSPAIYIQAGGHVDLFSDSNSGTSFIHSLNIPPGVIRLRPVEYFIPCSSCSTGAEYGLIDLTSFSSIVTTPVPEPQTYALLMAGLAGIAWVARQRSGNIRH